MSISFSVLKKLDEKVDNVIALFIPFTYSTNLHIEFPVNVLNTQCHIKYPQVSVNHECSEIILSYLE